MTTPQVPLVDLGNTLVAQVPVQLHTGSVKAPTGEKIGVVTLRTASTTLTIFLDADGLRSWTSLLTGLANELAGGLTVATAADIAVLNHRGRQ